MPDQSQPMIYLFTGCRSDYGLVKPIYAAFQGIDGMKAVLIASGSHFSKDLGETIQTVRRESPCLEEWDVFPEGLSASAFGRGIGRLLDMAVSRMERDMPRLVILAGDRIELLAVAQAALVMNVPIAHVGGGETTLGAFDEKIRSCLTMMAHWHFVGTEEFQKNVARMGVDPRMIFVVGETALDTILAQKDPGDEALRSILGFVPDRRTLLFTFHSETASADFGLPAFQECLSALEKAVESGYRIVATMPNNDPGCESLVPELRRFIVGDGERRKLVPAFGANLWAALLRRVGAMVGNSSSGLIEAPSFALPVVNVGRRQAGRLRARNVIDVPGDRKAIEEALAKACSDVFRTGLESMENPYGKGDSGSRIMEVLRRVVFQNVHPGNTVSG